MSWFYSGDTLGSETSMNHLVHNVLLHPDFKLDELQGFSAHQENGRVEKAAKLPENITASQVTFCEATVEIDVPSGSASVPSQKFLVPGLLYRKLTSVIQAAFADPLASHYHYSPFELHHICPITGKKDRVRSEVFNSDDFVEESERVQRYAPTPPDEPACTREKIVAALMFASDGTHLTNFGMAKAWPAYLMLGNLSKHIRAQPKAGALHHLAYIPSLPDAFQDWAKQFHAKWKTQRKDILTHCRRELMHAVWRLILDDDFVHAYKYGMVIKCLDGVERRVYPRIFAYSADYPEKSLLATIRDQGKCPCPRCLVLKLHADRLGQKFDISARKTQARTYLHDLVVKARQTIYTLAKSITSTAVEASLSPTSIVPTLNAFCERLGTAFNPFAMLVVDLLHEFELGVWKALFTHLIHLLYAISPNEELVSRLNERRYRQISTFGRGTIRRFTTNSAEMKKMAARDFEDLLQCSIPVFDRLLPEPHNKRLMKLLYRTAEWHALAKLQMHTDSTISLFEQLTSEFGKLMRQFRDTTCENFSTVETPSESSARGRRQARKHAQPVSSNTTPTQSNSTRRPKKLNLSTYKFHALGDYPNTIRRAGPTSNYSTQLGEAAHRIIKRIYKATNKRDPMKQIGKKYGLSYLLRPDLDEINSTPPETRYSIAKAHAETFDLFSFITVPDQAKHNFVLSLKTHIFNRVMQFDYDGDNIRELTIDQLNSVRIINNKLHRSNILRINYTTYDVRRNYDIISPLRHPFVMVKSRDAKEGAHPFWYAQVLGIFSATVAITRPTLEPEPQKLDMLWVRWFGDEPGYRSGRKYSKLPKIGFVPQTEDDAFGFLDPSLVIRGCHLIPSFADGRTDQLLGAGLSAARAKDDVDDWAKYYVNIFVDRDMFMRYLGGGIGHVHNLNEQTAEIENGNDDDGEEPEVEPEVGATEEDHAGEVPGEDSETDDDENVGDGSDSESDVDEAAEGARNRDSDEEDEEEDSGIDVTS
ncbi:hypothetical protein BDN72DRAFT_805276 [Pluteus cervinus]|uniref:Uncharacterized protein n=1 Tax=Pluteus cervinus TaxID=181527 RepID=A0ACD3A5W8_9AGAR|nr:hypothetical protein BDN72DRAFT_805276 [Pluteus cervinus]